MVINNIFCLLIFIGLTLLLTATFVTQFYISKYKSLCARLHDNTGFDFNNNLSE